MMLDGKINIHTGGSAILLQAPVLHNGVSVLYCKYTTKCKMFIYRSFVEPISDFKRCLQLEMLPWVVQRGNRQMTYMLV